MEQTLRTITQTSTKSERVAVTSDEPKTLVQMLLRSVRTHNKPDALNYKRGGVWRSISSDEILNRARNIALGLYSLGLRHGERVAILSENCPEWTLSDAGCLFGGFIDVPIYSTLTPQQVCYILNDSGARVLMTSSKARYLAMREELAACPGLERVIFFSESDVTPEDGLTLAQLEQRGAEIGISEPGLSEKLAFAVKPDDLATLIYTSGTTGEPKGVMLTHSNLTTNLIDSSGHLSFGESDVALSILPLSHVLERLAMYMYLHHGMSVFYAESIDKVGENVREVRPTILIAVPRLFEKIYAKVKDKATEAGKVKSAIFSWAIKVGKEHARMQLAHQKVPAMLALKYSLADKLVFQKWREGLGGRMRLFISGGAALSEEIGWIYQGVGLPIVQGYGLTETSPVIAAGNLEENRIGTVGKPIRNVEVRIASDGEIETRGPNIMQGYFKKPEATKAAFTEDGWFKTGDIGTLDEQGYLRITDRKKELFKTSGGKYIAPQPIEQMIKTSRFVNQVVLIGNGRKFPAALIVPDWEQMRAYAQHKGLSLKTPAEFCADPRILDLFQRQVDANTTVLAKYEKVKRVALIENEFSIAGGEMTPTLKVKRRVIDEKYKDVIDRIYSDAEHRTET
jgi:long-chain acyl-CoA synthetase